MASSPCLSTPSTPPPNIFNTARLEALSNDSELAGRWPRVSMPLGWSDFTSDRKRVGHHDDSISTDGHPTSRECLMVCVQLRRPLRIVSRFNASSTSSAVSAQSRAVVQPNAGPRLEDSLPSGASSERVEFGFVVLRSLELAGNLRAECYGGA